MTQIDRIQSDPVAGFRLIIPLSKLFCFHTFLRPILWDPAFYGTQKISNPNFVQIQHFLGPNFLDTNFLGPSFCKTQIIFLPKFFLDPLFVGPKQFLGPNIFFTKISGATFFLPNICYGTQTILAHRIV